MAKPVTAQMLAAIPAGDDNNFVQDFVTFQHGKNDVAGTAFAIIIFQSAIGSDNNP